MREGTILPADVTEAVVERVKEAFPGETVYTDLTPRDFERPCNMVELVSLGLDPLSYGQSGVDLLYKIKITTFSTVDVRSIEADASFFDCVPVTLTLALTLDRADFVGSELYELMQNLELQVRAKKENE